MHSLRKLFSQTSLQFLALEDRFLAVAFNISNCDIFSFCARVFDVLTALLQHLF